MQIVDVANLKQGRVFLQPLFHASGRKLLAAKATLSQEHINALVRSGIKQVFMAESARPVLEFGRSPATMVPVGTLALNAIFETDLLTPDGVVIIQKNEVVEDHHLCALRDSKIEFLIARPAADSDAIRDSLDVFAQLPLASMKNLIQRGEFLRAPESRAPFISTITVPINHKVLNIKAVQAFRKRLAIRLQPAFGMLETGTSLQLNLLTEITNELLNFMRSEPRQFSQLALMTDAREDHLPDHAISVAVLSMAIATHMKLSLDVIREIVMGSLLIDVGMLAIPKRIRSSSESLSGEDRQCVQQHPRHSLSMLELVPGLSPIARLMALQHHERLDGSGYPAASAGPDISDYARIAAVADIYSATANPRTYKSSKLPYTAVEELVRMANKGLLDTRAVKALIAAIGLFPVSSYVLLSNKMVAQVVGSNATKIDRPLIRPIVSGANPADAPYLDLASPQYAELKIIRAIPSSEAEEQPSAQASAAPAAAPAQQS